MIRQLAKRLPNRDRRVSSWGRFPSVDSLGNCVGVQYRLFRRDHRGAVHMEPVTFYREADRATIARLIRRTHHALRDRVDEIDLAAMGVPA